MCHCGVIYTETYLVKHVLINRVMYFDVRYCALLLVLGHPVYITYASVCSMLLCRYGQELNFK